MKRPPVVAALLGLASQLPLDAAADVGPPRRTDCFEAGAPCWIDGRDRGSCVDGECRLMAAPSASVSAEAVSAPPASTASPPAAAPTAGCACGFVVGDRDGETLALTLSLFSVVALTVKVVRRRRRVER